MPAAVLQMPGLLWPVIITLLLIYNGKRRSPVKFRHFHDSDPTGDLLSHESGESIPMSPASASQMKGSALNGTGSGQVNGSLSMVQCGGIPEQRSVKTMQNISPGTGNKEAGRVVAEENTGRTHNTGQGIVNVEQKHLSYEDIPETGVKGMMGTEKQGYVSAEGGAAS